MDYSDLTAKRWHKFLADRYGKIQKLNEAAGTAYKSFDEIFLPPCRFLSNPPDGPPVLQMDYLHFRREWVRDYLAIKRKLVQSAFPDKLLVAEMRQFGDHDGLAGKGEEKWGDACGCEIGYYYPPSMGPLVSRMPFKGWTPGGAPIWDVKKHEKVIGIMKSATYDCRYAGPSQGFEVNLPNGQSLFPNGQAMVYLPAEGKVVVGAPLTCVRDDGKILWTYKDDWAGPLSVFWQTTVPISDRDGLLIGTLGCIGQAKTKLGTIFAMPSSTGRLHLMTMDGLLVASIFQDSRVSRDWPNETRIGMPLGDATMGANWSGRFFQSGKSDCYLIAGSTACNVLKLNGFDSLKEISGGEVTVTGK